ncbi:MAG: VWA domain-containing protein [Verrucomicrobiota bacterium JB022]|nr:VWA domain-containing protein [Verrucomicrobiota bacterium JB022]
MDDLPIFRFAEPAWLLLLLLMPVLWWLRGRAGQRAAVRFSSVAIAGQISSLVKSRAGGWTRAIRPLALACGIIALARPQFGTEQQTMTSSGVDIMLTADLSDSMWAHDFIVDRKVVDRLTAVKRVMADFVREREHDRLGLIAFASDPYLISPLTLNHRWLQQWIEDLQIGMIDGTRTGIGDALGRAVNRLRNLDAESKIVILLTDGESNTGKLEPSLAAEAARASGVKVYTIGVGQSGEVQYPRFDRNGNPVRNSSGELLMRWVTTSVNFESLQEIADVTGGKFYRATNSEQLKEIYDEIDQLEKREVNINLWIDYAEAYIWPLALAFALLVLEAVLALTLYRRLP